MDTFSILLPAFAVSLGVFLALWPVSVLIRDVSIVDAWWGPGFLAAGLVAWAGSGGLRESLLIVLIGIWALRLGFIMIRRRIVHGEEDSRYQMIRESWGPAFWWKSFFIVFALQGVLQCIIALPPLIVFTTETTPLGMLGIFGALIAVIGLIIEAISDAQLDRFKKTAPKGAVCRTGLRAYVRHPNYTGEMVFWSGIWVVAAEAGAWWTVISPLILIFLLTRVSGAPMMTASMTRTRPEYMEYVQSTPAFIPRFGSRVPEPAE